jgi:hypothetical protein
MNSARPYSVGRGLRLLLAALLLGPSAGPAFSADWRLSAVRQTPYGTSLAFLDLSSIKGGAGEVSFAASTYFNRRTGRMNRVSVRVRANCEAMTYRFDEIVSFYNQRTLHRWAPVRTATAIPQTNVFDEISSACGIRDLGSHVDNPEAFVARYFAEQRRRGA